MFFMVKIECFIPEEYVTQLRDALNDTGALTVDGSYDYCMAVSKVKGSWRALAGADPYMGNIGEICEAEEAKVEFTCKKELCKIAVDTIKRIHPYEKPVINVIPLVTYP
ncbi:MAG: cytochrome C biogenesis protein [Acetivibrionales bacterium]